MLPRSTTQGRHKPAKPDTGGATTPPLPDIAEEHPVEERQGTGATVASSSSRDRANPRELPPTADPTGELSPAMSGVDDPYYQVAPDQWMQPGPSNRLGNILAGPAQSKPRTTRPSARPSSGATEPPRFAPQEATGSPAGDVTPTQATLQALLSAVTNVVQGMDNIRSEMTDVRQQLSDIQQMQAGLSGPSRLSGTELRPAHT